MPFFAVANIQASVRFYVDGLGFKMTDQWTVKGDLRWCRLELGGAGLMLQQFPAQGHDAWTPQGKVGEGVSLYFICQDALVIYHELTARGKQPALPLVSNGMWMIALTDPYGYQLYFESVTAEPEGTQYSG